MADFALSNKATVPKERARRNRVKDPAADAAKREREATLARAREAIAARVKARFARDMKVLDACEALFIPGVEIETLENCGSILRQQDYKDCVKERTLRGLCGYPLCAAAPSPTRDCGASFTVVLQKPGVFHSKVLIVSLPIISINSFEMLSFDNSTLRKRLDRIPGKESKQPSARLIIDGVPLYRAANTSARMGVTQLPASSWTRSIFLPRQRPARRERDRGSLLSRPPVQPTL
jgi:hypothetical protein